MAATVPWPDLLNPEPTLTVDAQGLERAMAFSFVASDDAGVLATALDGVRIAASDFDPTCFFDELFVAELAHSVMRVSIDQRPVAVNERYLQRLLAHPPRAPEALSQRSEVFRELEQTPVRKALERAYLHIVALRRMFEGEGRVNIRGEQARRRLDILKAVQQTFGALAVTEFASASSALARIAAYAQHARKSAALVQLDDLLRYESERAHAKLTVQLGADGNIRAMHVVSLKEAAASRYHVPLFMRWFGRVLLWLRGYRITDGEVLDRWLDQVFEGINPFLPPLLQLQGDIEFYLSGLAMRDALRERGLSVCFPEWVSASDPTRIEDLVNPLLLGVESHPVPCTVELSPAASITLLTGPNSGGKTRLLQGVGLLQLCAHAGMPVPASSARLPRVPGIFASLSQPASAEQHEGRLGTELLRIRMLFERARSGYLVLIDELCSGTSPSEGEELFRLVLELLAELAPVALVSTHFLKFAAALTEDASLPSLHFLQVELDAADHPTYRFVTGVASTSLARQTAARLGVTREELRALMQRSKS